MVLHACRGRSNREVGLLSSAAGEVAEGFPARGETCPAVRSRESHCIGVAGWL